MVGLVGRNTNAVASSQFLSKNTWSRSITWNRALRCLKSTECKVARVKVAQPATRAVSFTCFYAAISCFLSRKDENIQEYIQNRFVSVILFCIPLCQVGVDTQSRVKAKATGGTPVLPLNECRIWEIEGGGVHEGDTREASAETWLEVVCFFSFFLYS